MTWYLPGQKCVEREVRDEDAVQELHDPGEHEEYQERIDEFQPLRRVVRVGFPQRLDCINGRRRLLFRDSLLGSHWADNSRGHGAAGPSDVAGDGCNDRGCHVTPPHSFR